MTEQFGSGEAYADNGANVVTAHVEQKISTSSQSVQKIPWYRSAAARVCTQAAVLCGTVLLAGTIAGPIEPSSGCSADTGYKPGGAALIDGEPSDSDEVQDDASQETEIFEAGDDADIENENTPDILRRPVQPKADTFPQADTGTRTTTLPGVSDTTFFVPNSVYPNRFWNTHTAVWGVRPTVIALALLPDSTSIEAQRRIQEAHQRHIADFYNAYDRLFMQKFGSSSATDELILPVTTLISNRLGGERNQEAYDKVKTEVYNALLRKYESELKSKGYYSYDNIYNLTAAIGEMMMKTPRPDGKYPTGVRIVTYAQTLADQDGSFAQSGIGLSVLAKPNNTDPLAKAVVAHEMAHPEGARDQYAGSSSNTCDAMGGYLSNAVKADGITPDMLFRDATRNRHSRQRGTAEQNAYCVQEPRAGLMYSSSFGSDPYRDPFSFTLSESSANQMGRLADVNTDGIPDIYGTITFESQGNGTFKVTNHPLPVDKRYSPQVHNAGIQEVFVYDKETGTTTTLFDKTALDRETAGVSTAYEVASTLVRVQNPAIEAAIKDPDGRFILVAQATEGMAASNGSIFVGAEAGKTQNMYLPLIGR